MRHLIIRICCLLLIISSIGIVTPQTAHAASDLTPKSLCSLGNQEFAWGGNAELHDNGLLYLARTISPVAYVKNRAYIAIYAIDPNTAVDGSCAIVATYLDTVDNFTTITALYNPTVIARDSQGNLYAGKSTNNSYRLLIIPDSAPANEPFKGILKRNILSGPQKKEFYNFSSLGVTDNYVMISMNSWNGGTNLYADYTVVPTATIKDSNMELVSTVTWKTLGGPLTLGLIDTIVGMPDGRFFVSAFFANYVLYAAFINPVTGAVTNAFDPSKSGMGSVNCKVPNLHFSNYQYCAFPTASIGLDGNLYYSANVVLGDLKTIVAWRYNPNINKWLGIGNLQNGSEISLFNELEPGIGGARVTADADGNVVAIINSMKKPSTLLAFLNKKTNIWSIAAPNPKYSSFGKPDVNFITTEDTQRISAIFPLNGVLFWATYTAPINISSTNCNPNVVIESGSYYVNKTSVSGTIYTADTCKAVRYFAVASTNIVPVDPSDTTLIKPFSPDNGNFSVSGLVPGLNYVHVRLYDKSAALEKWVTNSVYVDTNATVQASVALDNGKTIPNFKDTWNMRASSYTASEYTRSSIGTIRITGVTDPSGLASYAINDQPAVAFDSNNINQPIPVNFNSITSTVGISLTLTDGAGNTEIRGIRPLTYDVEPPSISVDPTPAFTATTGVFSGTIGLTGGTITDDLYSASGRQYWGVWVANAKCVGDVVGGCPTATDSQLRWGAVPVTDPTSIPWNLLHGVNQVPSSGLYRTYIRVLDGAGNASTTAVTVDTTVTMTENKIYMPLNFSQR
jgi:hypothetical protein